MSDDLRAEAEAFWKGRCLGCTHPLHEMTCHEMANGDPSNGPTYCPCSVNMEWMEQEIVRLRAALAASDGLAVDWLRSAYPGIAEQFEMRRADALRSTPEAE